VNQTQPPPAPEALSAAYFALLYTPRAQRARLRLLFALARELDARASVTLDHSLSHVRLEWWREELERFAAGEPRHPWLRDLLAQDAMSRQLPLRPLLDAAAMDLASRTLQRQRGSALASALFVAAAQVLCGATAATLVTGNDATDATGAALAAVLAQLGEAAHAQDRARLRAAAAAIAPAQQAALRPLLVWSALAARRGSRLAPASQRAAMLAAFTDNIAAWRAARRAARGRFAMD
jgi:phytoene/squalene synthetase